MGPYLFIKKHVGIKAATEISEVANRSCQITVAFLYVQWTRCLAYTGAKISVRAYKFPRVEPET